MPLYDDFKDALYEIDFVENLKIENKQLKNQLKLYKDYIGDNMIMSDYQSVDNMRAELQFYKDKLEKIRETSECPPDCPLEKWIKVLVSAYHENMVIKCLIEENIEKE